MTDLVLKLDSPVKTIPLFSEGSGIPLESVRKMVKEGDLPIMPKKKRTGRVLINMVAYYAMCAKAANVATTC